jgi:hypothetical protein
MVDMLYPPRVFLAKLGSVFGRDLERSCVSRADLEGELCLRRCCGESVSYMAVLLKQGPSSSMTTMDNRVGEGQGGMAATRCIDYSVVSQLV